eukprot:3540114-Amphidinium_carterae.1
MRKALPWWALHVLVSDAFHSNDTRPRIAHAPSSSRTGLSHESSARAKRAKIEKKKLVLHIVFTTISLRVASCDFTGAVGNLQTRARDTIDEFLFSEAAR